MGMSLTGDWDKFMNLANVESAMRDHMGAALARGAEVVRGSVVKFIRDQKGNWPALKPETIERKEKEGQSDLTLIAEGDYMSSITTDQRAWDEVHVGTNHPQARAQEFGYEPAGIPARAHFWPGTEEAIGDYLEELQQGLATMFQSLMR